MNAGLGHSDFFKETYLQVAKNNNKFTIKVLFLIFWAPGLFFIPTPIIDLYNGEYRKNEALNIRYTFDKHSPGFYELMFILESLTIVFGNWKKFANDCFFLAVFRNLVVYLKYLSASIRTLGQDFEKNSDDGTKRKLIKWLKLHEQVIRNTNELISLYTPVICIYYANLICMVVFSIFTQLKHESESWQSIGLGAFCILNFFQLYMQCSTNEEVGTEADKLVFEIYNTPWYEMSKSNKDIIRMIQRMAYKPVDITAFKSPTLRLNKESFLTFVSSTITAVIAFSQMSDLHH
nr:odorant receptor 86 [Graphosoma rubrolineatum]